MAHHFTGSAERMTEQSLSDAEQELGRTIPEPYRSLLFANNGGRPQATGFQVPDGEGDNAQSASIRTFFGINMPEKTWNLEYILDTFDGRIPDWSFPIARDAGGNLILLGESGVQQKKIYYWDHDREADEGEGAREDNVRLLASSLTDFLDKLSPE